MSNNNLPPIPAHREKYMIWTPQETEAIEAYGQACFALGRATAVRDYINTGDAVTAVRCVGCEVSLDVSTGEEDATHRIFGRVESVMPSASGGLLLLAVEESRNFAAASGAGVPSGWTISSTDNGVGMKVRSDDGFFAVFYDKDRDVRSEVACKFLRELAAARAVDTCIITAIKPGVFSVVSTDSMVYVDKGDGNIHAYSRASADNTTGVLTAATAAAPDEPKTNWAELGFVPGATVEKDSGKSWACQAVIHFVHENGAIDVTADGVDYGWSANHCKILKGPK